MTDPSEDLKREIAHQLYINRNKPHSDTTHNAQTDWAKAEAISRSPLRRTLFRLNQPLIGTERRLEGVLAWLQRAALIEILALIGNLGLIVAVLTYLGTEKQRRDAEVYNAWQTITSAYGQSGNGGRIDALEFLNASPGANWRRRIFPICLKRQVICWFWPKESLAGVDASRAYLLGIELKEADLQGAKLAWTTLGQAELSRAFLLEANLRGANLFDANLREAGLMGANLEEAYLSGTNFLAADLRGVNFAKADLSFANLEQARFNPDPDNHARWEVRGVIRAVTLNAESVNFSAADLTGSNLEKTDLTKDNLEGVILCKTKLPEGLSIDPDRDCP
ncbi:MAG: pentapeptide repeat-containing protein [Cyanobacteria bacterium J06638_20]